ncbi:MAG: DUF3859 domain-containing protein [Rhodobacteraceae bacterium]|nr:DUF3859 domain-containing protein [Paracoccaceae bacterium]MBR9820339.1 DUF3859 domain-containing protein [Paracoccaceae bacterium]
MMTRAAPLRKTLRPALRGGLAGMLRGATLLLLPALPATAEGTTPLADILLPPLEMNEAGIYCPADHVAREPAPETESGYILLTEENPELVLASRVVPAYIGISFGIRIRLAPEAAPGPYLFTVRHPPVGPRQVTTESWNPALASRWGVRSFNFEFDRELVTGTWTFEVSRDDVVLLRQSFEVVPPMQAPEAIDLCFGNTFVS